MASKELKYIAATFVNNTQFSMVCYLLHVHVHVQSKANGNLETILYTYMCTCMHILNLYMLSHTGNDGCTMNIHLLRHIVDCVRNWGPLWGYSCLSFESMNGHLKTHFHGTRSMNAQVRIQVLVQCICMCMCTFVHTCTCIFLHVDFCMQLAFSYAMAQALPISLMDSSHNSKTLYCTPMMQVNIHMCTLQNCTVKLHGPWISPNNNVGTRCALCSVPVIQC